MGGDEGRVAVKKTKTVTGSCNRAWVYTEHKHVELVSLQKVRVHLALGNTNRLKPLALAFI